MGCCSSTIAWYRQNPRSQNSTPISKGASSNGRDAVTVAREWQPHLILMDRRMPVMDGLTSARELRKMALEPRPAIIAVTAQAYSEEQQEMLAAGCDAFLRKPFREQELFDLLAKHLDIRVQYAEPAPPAAEVPPLTPESFAGLPDDLRAALLDAVTNLDMAAVEKRIAEICLQNPVLAAQLKCEADKLAYSNILHALKSAG